MQNFAQTQLYFQFFLDNRHQNINADGNPDLSLDSILGSSKECLDSQVLLFLFEKDFYLHKAALANKPPSGTTYDPEGDGKALETLGVHEHWNNPKERKYSRNLGTGKGIELLTQL